MKSTRRHRQDAHGQQDGLTEAEAARVVRAGRCVDQAARGELRPSSRSVQFTKEMKEAGYTILAPQMAPISFRAVGGDIPASFGYNVELLPSVDHGAVDAGLKYVNNDICYPSILVTGQIMEAVMSGRYDTDKLAVHHHADRRRLPRDQLHRAYPQGVGGGGSGAYPGHLAVVQEARARANPGFEMTPKMLAAGDLRRAATAIC